MVREAAIGLALVVWGATPAAAEPATNEVRVAWWNDLFSELPPADDSGFTNDFELEVWRGRFGGRVFYRIFTEQFGEGDFAIPTRRWDQLDLLATAREARSWRGVDLGGRLRAGVTLGGDLGGLAIQDSFHRITGAGASTDEGLQSEYEGPARYGLITGLRLAAERPIGALRPGVAVDGQLALGSGGVTHGAAMATVAVEVGPESSLFLIAGELGVAGYRTADPNLELTGGYGTGGSALVARVSLGVRIGETAFGYQYRANEAGSGEPVGLLWLSIE